MVFDPACNFVVNESPVGFQEFFLSQVFPMHKDKFVIKAVFVDIIFLLADNCLLFAVIVDLIDCVYVRLLSIHI